MPGLEIESKLLHMLSMSRKAGKLLLGFDSVREGLAGGRVFAAFVSASASQKTQKEVEFFSKKYRVPFMRLQIPAEVLRRFTGREAAVMGISDKNFAEKILSLAGDFQQYLAVSNSDFGGLSIDN
ncbi:MAG: hypothetical protein LBC56_03690 [Oscillospiraceae bacterium]|jgi:ribosomal protein L7Ae-like RNA K-turn-binding protein|nr:hypothetical protein [Oscillospiraceae bacterium]